MTSRFDRLFDVFAGAACIAALMVALDTVRGLEWPYDGDHYRDIAAAQVARDGHPLSDPHYAGEWFWYNPLLPWMVAAGSAVARTTPAAFHVQSGPWLNLLAPIAFYVLGGRLAGRAAAFAALVIFLFFNCRADPALVCPTYSPWLFVSTFAQGLFFLAVLAIVHTRDRGRLAEGRAVVGWSAVAGALAGLTFLAHAGPALVLGGIALWLLPRRALLVAGVTAALVASPFLYAIVWHYGLRVVNPVPMAWPWLPVTLAGFPETLRDNAVLIAAGVAGAFIVKHRAARAWLIVSLALTAYGLGRELAPSLPALVPTFHFWRYGVAALTLLAGATVWMICQRVARQYDAPLIITAAVIAVVMYFPQYRSRFDLVYGRSIAEGRSPTHAETTAFLRQSTPPDSVILGSRGAALQIIGPAGRRVVAVNANWSNPYVENSTRVTDRDAMLEAIKAGDSPRFAALADAYRVTHVVGVGAEECAELRKPELGLLYDFGDVCVFRRR